MSDSDHLGSAWHLPPSVYAVQRQPTHAQRGNLTSRYVEMADGCRLAIDVHLPRAMAGGPAAPARAEAGLFPTIVVFTPYTRRFSKTDPAAEESPNTGKYTRFFVQYGYAVVVVDMRGTGASFGSRVALRSPQEREDTRQIAEWIVNQPWSDGIIGSTGISYLGAAASFLASTGHPAVKAIAPLFAVSDIYSEQLFPGGMLSRIWSRDYDELMVGLDNNDRQALKRFAYFGDPRLSGPMPVDEDADGSLLAEALAQHRDNFRLHDMMPELAFRDEGPLHDPALTTDACSPFHYLRRGIRPGVPVYSVSGWYDGGGYANGAVSRFLTLAGPKDRLLLGPWDHGARTNVSPWRDRVAPDFPLMHELLRFFDEHLQGRRTGIEQEAAIHYYCIHAQRWLAADVWPPVPSQRWHFHAGGEIRETPSATDGCDVYQVRFDTTTGEHTRWERLGAREIDTYYDDWLGRDARMLNYATRPFAVDTELTGHIVVTLSVASSEPDAALFAYATEIEADGTRRYITEGMLRMLHRKTADAPADYVTAWPYRRFYRQDAERLAPGQPASCAFALLPISWCLKKGSKLQISLAGADADHFPQTPHGRPPRLTILTGAAGGSFVDLPIRGSAA